VVVAARTINEGDHAFLTGSLSSTVSAIEAAGGQAHAVACDVSIEDACNELIAEAKSTYGPVDVLVNNAALSYFIPVVDFPTNRWFRSRSTSGPSCLKAVLPT
jgi:NAD(P)-dependent dehydrogenase (short-subunit alcohol dehydrogenase family)